MPIAVIVGWYGPYRSYKAFQREAQNWPQGTRTLYMALGPYNTYRYWRSTFENCSIRSSRT